MGERDVAATRRDSHCHPRTPPPRTPRRAINIVARRVNAMDVDDRVRAQVKDFDLGAGRRR
jgi:hypothetical protein